MKDYTCAKCGEVVSHINYLRKLKMLLCNVCIEWGWKEEEKMKK